MSYCAHCGRSVTEGAGFCPVCGKDPSGARRVPLKAPASSGMSTAIKVVLGVGGVFVLIAFVGIVAAILVPNFIDALQKAKQKRTLADFRDVGIALNAYALDNGQFPDVTTIAALSTALEPDYLEEMPRTDAWDNAFVYRCGSGPWGSDGCQGFRLVSAGRDGVFEFDDPWSYEEGVIERGRYDEDLVMATEGPLREPVSYRQLEGN